MKIISVMNQKGGVGKTTVSIHLATGVALAKKRVLLIDADLQGNATVALGLECRKEKDFACDLFAVLTKQCSFEQAKITRSVMYQNKKAMFDIVPATVALSGFDQLVRALPNKQVLLKQLLQDVVKNQNYDYVFIDCAPSLGLLTINALVACDELLIPVQPEFFALHGLSQLLDTVAMLQGSLNPHLKIGGIICTRFNRRKIHNEVLSCLHERFGKALFATKIYENIALAEAPSHGQTIFEYSPSCIGSNDFDLLCHEFLNRQIQTNLAERESLNPANRVGV